jgi:hypothetical protein
VRICLGPIISPRRRRKSRHVGDDPAFPDRRPDARILPAQAPYEKRAQFLERIAAMLAFRARGNLTDEDVTDVVKLASVGPVH